MMQKELRGRLSKMQNSKFGKGYSPKYRKTAATPKGYSVSYNRHSNNWSFKDPQGKTWMMPKAYTRLKTVAACYEHKRQNEERTSASLRE